MFNTSFGSYNKGIISAETDLVGKDIITRSGLHGMVLENIINNSGKAVGYIVKQGAGDRISVLKSDVIQII